MIKQFVTALNSESESYKILRDLFPFLSDAKVKAGVFTGPQVRKIIGCNEFEAKLSEVERKAWQSFVAVVNGFLGNRRAENYVELVSNLVKAYGEMGCLMSLKIHILDSHLENFKENMGNYSQEQGERFH